MNKGTVGMSIEIISQVISVLPNDVVAIYGMCRSISKGPIYIGQSTTLKDRLTQHFIYKNLILSLDKTDILSIPIIAGHSLVDAVRI